ncbi:gamma-interferon-inducible lysosomal thiol reductase-like [Durio zibethinus]|uniref:Gamma-interferon-inducible lysosomal thiol reductase-like n=1 Tax=Durio zibethinus TaxID=66656 RepID=A0A6P5YUP1_DURZI|nr:gamma-interferon-inducible lysosomal thiol reductase-like [Durio zibethinus]
MTSFKKKAYIFVHAHYLFSKMAFCKLVFPVVIACLFFLFTFSSHASEGTDAGFKVSTPNSNSSSQNVNISIYYEAFCLHCAKFIVNKLEGLFENGLISIINLTLVPWGDSYIDKSNNTIICKHGQEECQLNTIEACAIHVWPDVNKHYGLIYCIEFLAIEGRQKEWESCFDSLGLPQKHILDCYNSGKGRTLELAYANETAHLSPPHAYTPWVVVNNLSIGNDYENLEAYICKAYKGNAAPDSCKSIPPDINSTGNAKNLKSSTPTKKMHSR